MHIANQEKSAGNSWKEFSVKSPSRDKYSEKNTQGVTGNEYENGSKVTGPFDTVSYTHLTLPTSVTV